MALEVRTREQGGGSVRADRRLYLTADKSRVVEHGDPDAAWLLAGVGGQIPPAEADRLGLEVRDGRVQLRAVAPPEIARSEDEGRPAPEKPRGRAKKKE